MQLVEVTARSGLVIRRMPDGNAERIVAMPFGMRAERLDGQVWNGGWYRIRAYFSGGYVAEGYSASAYLAPVTPAPEPTPSPVEAPAVPRLHPLTPPETARRQTEELHSGFARRLTRLLESCKRKGLKFKLFEAYRTPERQAYLFEQGRSRPGSIVTNADAWRSIHNYGLAADLILDIPGINPWETGTVEGVDYMACWKRMRRLADKAGLKTLSWDLPHVEMPGTSWQVLAKADLPPGGGADWAANLDRMIRQFANPKVLDGPALHAALNLDQPAPPRPARRVSDPAPLGDDSAAHPDAA